MNKKYLVGIGILLVIVLICTLAIWKNKNTHQMGSSKPSMSHRAPLPKEVTITLNKNGFSPIKITINVGTAVRWKNVSGKPETVNSDNYPTNQLHRELNFGIFANGSTVTYTFMKEGTYGYHNQLNHEQSGEIVVKN